MPQRIRLTLLFAVLLGLLLLQWRHTSQLGHPLIYESKANATLSTRGSSSSILHSPFSTVPAAKHSGSTNAKACRVQAAQHAQQLLRDCPGLPGYCPRSAQAQQIDYLDSQVPMHLGMAQQKLKVNEFIAGKGFQKRSSQLQQLPDERGIVISAGKNHVGNAAMMVHVLRRQHNCRLPIEIAHRGDAEFGPRDREAMSREFQPLYWLDLNKQRYPAHHNPQYTMDRYEPKIYALYHCRFQKVLMLDADNLPLRDPSYLFDSPHSTRHGSMFWLDYWSPLLSSTTFVGHDSVYRLLGINKEKYWETLSEGQGWLHRVAESGELVLDRVRHADVLEYLWWLTSFSAELYKHVLGDKDTFGFAFAMAGKLHELYAVAVPPGAAFVHQRGADGGKGPSWRFHAMLQFDHLGQPAFFHRTFEKWHDITKPPAIMDVVSGPLPNRFIMSYLGNRSIALSPDLPEHVLGPVRLNCPAPVVKYVDDSSSYRVAPDKYKLGSCPLATYLEYLQLLDWGLPIRKQQHLEEVCAPMWQHLQALGSSEGADSKSGDSVWQQTGSAAARKGRSLLDRRAALSGRRRTLHTDISQDGHSWPLFEPNSANTSISTTVGAALHRQHQLPGAQMRQLHQNAVPADPSIGDAAASSSCTGSSWLGELNADIWLSACVQLQGKTKPIGRIRLHHQRGLSQATSGEAHVEQQPDDEGSGLPACHEVSWHVARFVLREYAEMVAHNEAGLAVADADAKLPVLQLTNQGPLAEQQGHSSGRGDACSKVVGVSSEMDVLQHQAIPASRKWALQHLPSLAGTKK